MDHDDYVNLHVLLLVGPGLVSMSPAQRSSRAKYKALLAFVGFHFCMHINRRAKVSTWSLYTNNNNLCCVPV